MSYGNIPSAKRQRNLENARALQRAEVLEWYLANNFQVPPVSQCEVKKPYKGMILWWLEPLIKRDGVQNPILIEEYLGDNWTCRLERHPDCPNT